VPECIKPRHEREKWQDENEVQTVWEASSVKAWRENLSGPTEAKPKHESVSGTACVCLLITDSLFAHCLLLLKADLCPLKVSRASLTKRGVTGCGECVRGRAWVRCHTGRRDTSTEGTISAAASLWCGWFFEELTPFSFSQCLEPCKESWDLKENQCQDLCEVCHYHKCCGYLRHECSSTLDLMANFTEGKVWRGCEVTLSAL